MKCCLGQCASNLNEHKLKNNKYKQLLPIFLFHSTWGAYIWWEITFLCFGVKIETAFLQRALLVTSEHFVVTRVEVFAASQRRRVAAIFLAIATGSQSTRRWCVVSGVALPRDVVEHQSIFTRLHWHDVAPTAAVVGHAVVGHVGVGPVQLVLADVRKIAARRWDVLWKFAFFRSRTEGPERTLEVAHELAPSAVVVHGAAAVGVGVQPILETVAQGGAVVTAGWGHIVGAACLEPGVERCSLGARLVPGEVLGLTLEVQVAPARLVGVKAVLAPATHGLEPAILFGHVHQFLARVGLGGENGLLLAAVLLRHRALVLARDVARGPLSQREGVASVGLTDAASVSDCAWPAVGLSTDILSVVACNTMVLKLLAVHSALFKLDLCGIRAPLSYTLYLQRPQLTLRITLSEFGP